MKDSIRHDCWSHPDELLMTMKDSIRHDCCSHPDELLMTIKDLIVRQNLYVAGPVVGALLAAGDFPCKGCKRNE